MKDKLKYCGASIMIFAWFFGVAETIYFGSNWLPSCTAELVCDFISVFFSSSGLTMILISYFIPNQPNT